MFSSSLTFSKAWFLYNNIPFPPKNFSYPVIYLGFRLVKAPYFSPRPLALTQLKGWNPNPLLCDRSYDFRSKSAFCSPPLFAPLKKTSIKDRYYFSPKSAIRFPFWNRQKTASQGLLFFFKGIFFYIANKKPLNCISPNRSDFKATHTPSDFLHNPPPPQPPLFPSK